MPTRHFTILLVDDDEPRRRATGRVLTTAGHSVLDTATGLDALELARQLPDVILLHVNLPDINGFQVCDKLKQDLQTASIPVIFISGTCPPWVGHDSAAAAGGTTFLIHPIEPEQLLAVIAGTVQGFSGPLQRRHTFSRGRGARAEQPARHSGKLETRSTANNVGLPPGAWGLPPGTCRLEPAA